MKLHLPKGLLVAVMTAVYSAGGVYAADTWETNASDTKTWYIVTKDTETISAYGEGVPDKDCQIKAQGSDLKTVTNMVLKDGKTTSFMWEWNSRTNMDMLVEKLQFGEDGNGAGSIEVDPNQKLVINEIASTSTVSTLTNKGSLTIGGADTTSVFGSTIQNYGDITINGTVDISGNILDKFEMANKDSVSISYSYGNGNGFTTYTDAEYYLIKNVDSGQISGFTEQSGFTVNKDGETITSVTFTLASTKDEYFRVAGEISESTLLADANAGVDASTKYRLVGGTLTVAGDISSDRLVFESGTLALGTHTLDIKADAEAASDFLLNTTGSGVINLATTAQVSNVQSSFTGQLTIASGGVMIIGGKSGENGNYGSNTGSISNFSSVTLDGGKILHNAKSDTVDGVEYGLIHSLTVSANGGTFEVYDQNKDQDIHFDGTTTLNGTLTINTTWKQNTVFDAITGGGDIIINAGVNTGSSDSVQIKINDVAVVDSKGYSGEITVNNKSGSGGTTLYMGNNVDITNNKLNELSVVLNDGARMVVDGHDGNKDSAEGSQYIGKITLGTNASVNLNDGSYYINKGLYLNDGVTGTVENQWDKHQYVAGIHGTGATLVLRRMNNADWNTNYRTFILTEKGNFSGMLQLENSEADAGYNHGVTVTSAAKDALANTVVQFGTGDTDYGSVLVFSDKWAANDGEKIDGAVAGLTGDNGKVYAAELSINTAADASHTYGGSITATKIEKNGTGSQNFSGDMSSFSGDISAMAGVLAFTATDALSVNSLNVANVGTLEVSNNSAAGTISTSNATLAGGATINANLTLNSGGALEMNGMDGDNSVTVNGTLTLGSGIALTGEITDALSSGEQSVKLFSGITELNFTAAEGVTYSSSATVAYTGPVDFNNVFSVEGVDTSMYELTFSNGSLWASQMVVPEPATTTLSLLALAGLAMRRRRR